MFTLAEIAKYLEGTVYGDSHQKVNSISALQSSEAGSITFCSQSKFRDQLPICKATAVLVRDADRDQVVNSTAIVVANPYVAYALISKWFDWRLNITPNIHPQSHIDDSAEVSELAEISAGVVIGRNSVIHEGCYIGANSVIGDNCILAENCRIEANVTLYNDVQIEEATIVHAGAVIGADGFGFAKNQRHWEKIYQLGGVRIGANVEVGAGTTIDRGAISHTVIESGVKLDNQIQIAHNVRLGSHTAIAGGVAIAGSTVIGEQCTIAGMSGITGHLNIADNTHVTAMSLVSHSIKEPGGVYSSGTGIEPHTSWKKNVVRFKQLDTMAKRLKNIEKEISLFSTKGKKQ